MLSFTTFFHFIQVEDFKSCTVKFTLFSQLLLYSQGCASHHQYLIPEEKKPYAISSPCPIPTPRSPGHLLTVLHLYRLVYSGHFN